MCHIYVQRDKRAFCVICAQCAACVLNAISAQCYLRAFCVRCASCVARVLSAICAQLDVHIFCVMSPYVKINFFGRKLEMK